MIRQDGQLLCMGAVWLMTDHLRAEENLAKLDPVRRSALIARLREVLKTQD